MTISRLRTPLTACIRLHWSQKRHNTSGQNPDKEAEIRNITDYVRGYTESDKTGMLYPPTGAKMAPHVTWAHLT